MVNRLEWVFHLEVTIDLHRSFALDRSKLESPSGGLGNRLLRPIRHSNSTSITPGVSLLLAS